MKLASLLFALVLAANLMATSESTKTKVKNAVNDAAEKIDSGTRKLVNKSKSAWNKEKQKHKEAQEER